MTFNYKKGLTKMKRVILGLAGAGFLTMASLFWSLTALSPVAAAQEMPALTPATSNLSVSVSTMITIPITRRHVEPLGGFSYVPPLGWQLRDMPGFKYKAAFAPAIGNSASNLIFLDEANPASLETYVALNLATMKQLLPGLTIVSQEWFETSAGQWAIKVVVRSTQYQQKLQQTLYFFNGGTKKVIATYTRLANQGAELDPKSDASMQSFRFESNQ